MAGAFPVGGLKIHAPQGTAGPIVKCGRLSLGPSLSADAFPADRSTLEAENRWAARDDPSAGRFLYLSPARRQRSRLPLKSSISELKGPVLVSSTKRRSSSGISQESSIISRRITSSNSIIRS